MPGKKEKVSKQELPTTLTGVYIFPNGDKYDGEYSHLEDGGIVRSGYGIHTTSDGLVYKGIWENDKMNGKGVCHFNTGAVYDGEFVNNKMHGSGTYTFENGSTLKGVFHENRMTGNGEYTDLDGQIWYGQFENKAVNNLKFKLQM